MAKTATFFLAATLIVLNALNNMAQETAECAAYFGDQLDPTKYNL